MTAAQECGPSASESSTKAAAASSSAGSHSSVSADLARSLVPWGGVASTCGNAREEAVLPGMEFPPLLPRFLLCSVEAPTLGAWPSPSTPRPHSVTLSHRQGADSQDCQSLKRVKTQSKLYRSGTNDCPLVI
jgi:hypothetical protein